MGGNTCIPSFLGNVVSNRTLRICAIGLCLGVALSFLLVSCAHRPPAVEWTKTFAGRQTAHGYCVQQGSDGGYVVAGQTDSLTENVEFYLVKTDSGGGTEWARTFGGGGSIAAQSMQQTVDGGFILAGMGDLSTSGFFHGWLLKADSLGNTAWQGPIGDSVPLDGYSVVQATDGGYAVACLMCVRDADSALFLVEFDSLGNRTWERRYPTIGYPSWWDDVVQVRPTADKGYILAAQTLLKTDSLGNQQWLRTYGGVTGANSVVQTSDGGYAATGPGDDPQGKAKHCIFLSKTDAQGNLQWMSKYAQSSFSRGYWIEQTSDGGYVIAGSIRTTRDMGYILRTDASGAVVWCDTLPDAVNAECIRQTRDGGFVVTGTYYDAAANNNLLYLKKFARER